MIEEKSVRWEHGFQGSEHPETAALRVRKELADRFATQSLAAWTEFFDGIDCCVTPVLTLAEAREHQLFKD